MISDAFDCKDGFSDCASHRYFPGPLNVAALEKSLPGAECEGRRASPDTGETRQTSELGKPHALNNVKPTYCCT